MKKNYLPALTGLRAIAAYMVFLHHYFSGSIFLEFHIGVTIFFVLSGFLITLRYFDLLIAPNFLWKEYVINRVARIMPIYLLLTTFVFFIDYFQHHNPYSSNSSFLAVYILNITLLRGFFDNLKFSGIIQGWSLTVEECFYLIAPVIFFLIKKCVRWYYIVLAIYFIGVFLVFIFSELGNSALGFFRNYQFLFGFTFFGRCFEFFIGILFAKWFLKNRECKKIEIYKYTSIGIVSMSILIFIMSLVTKLFKVQDALYHPVGLIINNIILPFGIITLLRGLILENNFITKLLSSDLFQILGKSSYVFYLIHMGVIFQFVNSYLSGGNLFISFIILNLISFIIYRTLEDPLNKIVKRVLIRR